MARKVFISVLGAGFYSECIYGKDNYYGEGKHFRSSKTRYVQQATLEYLNAKSWSETDAAFILTTEKAFEDNWRETISKRRNPRSHQEEDYPGLQKVIKEMALPFKEARAIHIPDGINEEEIWQIFETLISGDGTEQFIQEGDELYFDLTHGFRYLPMLVLVLGNYLKFMKKVQKCSITYGNFEMKDSNEIAPIIDLLPLAALQDWTFAIADYLENGYTGQLSKLSSASLIPLISNRAKHIDEELKAQAFNLKMLIGSIKNMTDERQTCRGISVIESNSVEQIKANIDNVRKHIIKPFSPLISKISDSLKGFTPCNVLNNIYAAQWCFDNHQYQSATTFLEEGVISFFCDRHKLDYKDEDLRNLINSAIAMKKYGMSLSEMKIREDLTFTFLKIVNDPMLNEGDFSNIYSDFAFSVRNDYNHCGMRSKQPPLPPHKIISKIETAIVQIRERLENPLPLPEKKPSILINLSNHPQSVWDESQIAAAQVYGQIVDITFPTINPDAKEKDIADLTQKYGDMIEEQMQHFDVTVHIMGEMTLTYAIVSRMKALGIRCLASTTNRNTITTPDGKKISEFKFVQFREY